MSKNSDLSKTIGLQAQGKEDKFSFEQQLEFINFKLACRGRPIFGKVSDYPFIDISKPLLSSFFEKNRLLAEHLCPADRRIQTFLDGYFSDMDDLPSVQMPRGSLVLERHGIARMLSLPPDQDHHSCQGVSSYRVEQGILNNPRHDRRTTKGVFHIAEGGLPIPADKKAVPKAAVAHLLHHAFNPPADTLRLPFTASQKEQAEIFVSLLLRPVVCPDVSGFITQKSMEVRFLAPGSLVCCLDFVESIFGNAGDPYLPKNDAALDWEGWTGHSGCVVLAPHLTDLTKKELGLPSFEVASERQKRDGMCWQDPAEKYNDGTPFKISCRDENGVMVTLIADTYFGYCKKEIKTQISYSANLYGLCEEEHAGGALAFPSYDLGEDFNASDHAELTTKETFSQVADKYGSLFTLQPGGYGIDKEYDDIYYLPEHANIDLYQQRITWTNQDGQETLLPLVPHRTHIFPSGYRVEMKKPATGRRWRLVGTRTEGVLCHKPCTVSGGGKSEIAKPISDLIVQGPIFVANFQKDFQQVQKVLAYNYENRFRDPSRSQRPSRPILGPKRSLGSVMKLLTPSPEYNDEYNTWLQSIPLHIKELVLLVKRFYKLHWEDDWAHRFSVDSINEQPGHELKYHNRKLITNYLRMGFSEEGNWRTFGLRKDFHPATKLQMEDDISVSVTVPTRLLNGLSKPLPGQTAYKFIHNCEYRLFQRPDEAINRGHDLLTEKEMTQPNNFLCNYEPMVLDDAKMIVEDTIQFEKFSKPMQQFFSDFAAGKGNASYLVSSAHPRRQDGKICKNPRYLQDRPDLHNPRSQHLAEVGTRLGTGVPLDKPLLRPVDAVLPGHRNNPPLQSAGIRSLAVFNPIHYMELPELFMDFISSLTGKSPSTTGAGSEGALTKGPFNALQPVVDLNNALVSYILNSPNGCFITAAGHVGPKIRVDHDISLIVPEIWCRMTAEERDPRYMVEKGYLERCTIIEKNGQQVDFSRLGWRINSEFLIKFFGRVFSNPATVFTEEMLKPELQDLEVFCEGIDNIIATQKRVARLYFEDGSVDAACPPIKALLHIMAEGHYEGKGLESTDIREMFTPQYLVNSGWYKERLLCRQTRQKNLWKRHLEYVTDSGSHPVFYPFTTDADQLDITGMQSKALREIERLEDPGYVEELIGTIGADPLG